MTAKKSKSERDRGAPATPAATDATELLGDAHLFRFTDDATTLPEADDDSGEDTARVPRIMRMPEGIEVVEHRVVRAHAQWILEVRCECGRRWFELEEVPTAQCPRCMAIVRLEVEGRGPK